ncbi:hypothetical protein EAH88_18575 [Rhodanobacter glycinis]|uniref:Haemolysin-type calcium binding-related domain-containing protein n=1 Tax=Rhodanobacter glycinis TaxID=582702 RepID=A0A502BSC0_9GAMM|nr:calcium-binding protein [Rhodanobacter glycinis]TPG04115.1 hypothetical protein EAH88_18575 [Rhodanobacter glycinis]
MNQAIDKLDGIDALLNGDTEDFSNLSHNTAYYTPEAAASVAPAANSLENMIGLSDLIYSDGGLFSRGTLPSINDIVTVNGTKYSVIDKEDDPSGYQGLTLYDIASNIIIVVSKGTQTVQNFWTDAVMATATINNQWTAAYALGSRVADKAAALGVTTIYATGHSLGGSLTQMLAARFGWQGYTFNAYGADEVYQKLVQLGLVPPVNPNAHITNYRTMFDLVSDASTQIGNSMITFESPQDVSLLGSFYDFFNPLASLAADFLLTVGEDHGVGNFHGSKDLKGALLGSGNNVYTLAPGITAPPPSPQLVAIAADIVSSMAELIHLGLEAIPGVGPFESGNLSLQQSAEEVGQFIANEPVSGIKVIVPSDPSLLSHALDPAAANNAYRASLASLSPAVLQGLDPSSFINAGLWAPGQTTGLTKDYLVARNDMIQAMLAIDGGGQAGSGQISTNNANSYVYTDLARLPSPLYTLNGQGGSTYDVVFAGSTDTGLTAAPGAYAELFGGAGNDILFGGTVGSTLQGGAGNDDYIIDGDGSGVDAILDTDGQGKVEWKSGGTTQVLTGGNEVAGTSAWKSADGTITYSLGLAADGSTELEITGKNKIAYIDDFTNGEFGITLGVASAEPTGPINLASLTQTQYTDHVEYQDQNGRSANNLDDIFGVSTVGGKYNVIEGDWNAGYINVGDGNNIAFAGDLRYTAATEILDYPISVTIQGGSGNQLLVGMGNGDETIIGGNLGSDATAWDTIDGGGANGLLVGGSQSSLIFGGTGADTLIAGSTASGSTEPSPTTIAIAGLSFWGSSIDSGNGAANVTGEPGLGIPAFSDPGNFQIDLSLSQLDGSYAAPIGLLGSSLNSGSEDGPSTLPGSLLIGGTGSDYLIGNRGDDTLMGGTPTSPITGVVDEVLLGGAGADLIYGGSGTELIYADMSPGAVVGWANLDPTSVDTIHGGSGNEYIYGSGGNDVIYGSTGNYTIYVGNGNSYVETGSGSSIVYGGTGNDTIVVDGSSDSIQTGDGNSYVRAGGTQSTISTGAGNDTIEAAGGTSLISEGSGHTTVVAGPSTGSDTIQSSLGGTTVRLVGGLTESVAVVRDVNGDLVLSDPGFDTQITVAGYFVNGAEVSLQFEDGTTWGAPEILQASMTPRADGGNDTLIGSSGNDSITAGYGDTLIVGTSGSNTLTGGAGNDTIRGGSGADTIQGGSGTTQIMGGAGLETYVFNIGDGSDTIAESTATAGTDALSFGSGIVSSQVIFSHISSTNDLLVSLGTASPSTITISNFFATGVNQHDVGTFKFSDGTTLTQAQVLQKTGAINGTSGNDTLTGFGTVNYFDGKGGNDVENGISSNDTFVFNPGYGHLEILEGYAPNAGSVLLLGAGITASSLHVTSDRSNMDLTDGISGDQIQLDRVFWFDSYQGGVPAVQFADGTTLTATQLYQMEITGGTSGSDTLSGTASADYLDGKGGNDLEEGNGGNDTFVFNAGYGYLEITEDHNRLGNDQPVLQLGAGITASSLRVTAVDKSNLSSLYVTDGVMGDQIKLNNEASPSSEVGIQLADGTALTDVQLLQMAIDAEATAGNDTISGYGGSDLIDGKGGNDLVVDYSSEDTFVFDPGYGNLEISNSADTGTNETVLSLGAGITAQSLHVTSDGYSLYLTDGISGDRIKFDYMVEWGGFGHYGVSSLQLADGSTIDTAQLIQMELSNASSQNDTLSGSMGDDYIDGKGGSDLIYDNGGNDTVVFNAGYGHLEIAKQLHEYSSTGLTTIKLGVGISESSIQVRELLPLHTENVSGYVGSELVLTDGVTGDQITIDGSADYYDYFGNGSTPQVQFADGSILTGDQLLQRAIQLNATTSNDTLVGSSAADTIDGKGGDDEAIGNGGNDTFVFNAGYGNLDIVERHVNSPQSVLKLGAGITVSNLRADEESPNLQGGWSVVLYDGIRGDQITLDGMLDINGGGYGGVSLVQFADGTTLSAAQVSDMAYNRLSAAQEHPVLNVDTITGSAGSDNLLGTLGSDYFVGMGGNDTEQGGGGNDTFVFNSGYGHLEINEQYSSQFTPVLLFGPGILTSKLLVMTDGTSLYLTDGIGTDQVTLDNEYSSQDPNAATEVQFADGEVLAGSQLEEMALWPVTGTTGSDALVGTSKAERLDGKGGGDSVDGGGGNDVFVFNAGYGQLQINEQYTSDQAPVLLLGAGIALSDLVVQTNGTDLYLTDAVSNDRVTLAGGFANSGSNGVTKVQFADGTVLTDTQLDQMAGQLLDGTTGNDTLSGTPNADRIDGKGGSDSVTGGGGNDTFIFNSGYGYLEINEGFASDEQPVLQLGAGITLTTLHVTKSGSNILLTDGVGGDQITLDTMSTSSTYGVATVQLTDGTTLTRSQLIQMETIGTPGNDTLQGTSGGDLFDGRGGNDSLVGGGGNDTFIFNAGYGHLEINETHTSSQHPVLQLGAGISASALHVTEISNNLLLTDGVSGDQITLDTMWSSTTHGVATVQLADGTTLTRSQLIQMEMTGTMGNDTLQGTSGADLLDGDGGNDSVVGGGGNDTFVFNTGYGDLEINESFTSSQHPVLQLGAGITASTLRVVKSGNNLLLTDGISGDQVTLDSMSSSSTHGVATVQLADGTTLTRSQLIQMETIGTTGNDTLQGTSAAELIDGKGGNDSVVGGGGNDTFVFNSGYGQLVINETHTSTQTPVLQFGAGITTSTLVITKSGSNLVLTDGVAGDQVTLNNMSSSSTSGVATVKLADGTTLTRSQLIQRETAAVVKTPSAPLATSDNTPLLQINPLIHAIAAYMGNGGGGGMTSAVIPPATTDVMLHAAA